MTDLLPPAGAACLAALESALAGGPRPDLGRVEEDILEAALRALGRAHGSAAVPLLRELAANTPAREVRRALRRALYRLGESGAAAAPEATSRAVVTRDPVRASRAWVSGIDGAGSRAIWIVFEGGLGGGQSLCSLILNDEVGILEVAGGPVTRKRLDQELASLYRDQKLPWVEMSPARVCGLVREALAIHARAGGRPPAAYARWAPFFAAVPAEDPDPPGFTGDPVLVERSAELLDLPELAGWFADPATISEAALSLLEMRDSRLVVSDQVKAEREAVIVERAAERVFSPGARTLWAGRLAEMTIIFGATGREEPARLAAATAAALRDPERTLTSIPWVTAMTRRGLEVAGDVALGRTRLQDVQRSRLGEVRP